MQSFECAHLGKEQKIANISYSSSVKLKDVKWVILDNEMLKWVGCFKLNYRKGREESRKERQRKRGRQSGSSWSGYPILGLWALAVAPCAPKVTILRSPEWPCSRRVIRLAINQVITLGLLFGQVCRPMGKKEYTTAAAKCASLPNWALFVGI